MTDRSLWLVGAASTAFGLLLGNIVLAYVPDAIYTGTRFALLLIPAAAAFAVAYHAEHAGFGKALLYIPLLMSLAIMLTLLAWMAHVDTGYSSLADLFRLAGMAALLFSPPILLGALAGWAARRQRAR